MGIFDDIGGWIDKNSGWLKPVTQFVGNIGGSALDSRNQDAYLDSLRRAEDRNYADAKALYDAQVAYANASGGGGDGGRAAAARANEANRVKAAKKGLKREKKGFKDIRELYQPFKESAQALLPGMQGLYMQGANNLNTLNPIFSNPANLTPQSKAAYQIDIPIPDYLVGRKA